MSNTLTAAIPQLLASGLMALRQQAFWPRTVNRGFERLAGEKGSTIDVPISSAITVQAVSPAATPPATADTTLDKVQITLDKWYEAPFYLTDKELLEVADGVVPMQAQEAVKSLANQVNSDGFALYKGIYGYAGVAATTPFSTDLSEAINARKVLSTQLAPMSPRYMVLDPTAEATALNLRALQDASWRNNASGLVEGQIGRIMGFDWYSHQLVPTHTAGTITTGLIAKASTAVAAGLKTCVATTAASTGACALLVGDIILFAGSTQTHVLTAVATQASAATDVTLTFEPGLAVALAGSEAITVKASHVVNLAYHRDCFAFASRPLETSIAPGLNALVRSIADEQSGLTLRLEITREHKRTRYSYDILYGVKCVRPALGARVAG